MDKRGVTTIATAVLGATLVGATGLAVDTTRLALVEARLRTAVDAATLTAARRLNDTGRDAEAQAIFAGHFDRTGPSLSYLGATITPVSLVPDPTDSSRICAEASASVPMWLFGLASGGPVTRTASAVAQRAGTGLELAIVLDQTSSMRQASGTGGTKLDAARAAIGTMLDSLYNGRDVQPNLWVSVVPFARTVNIGTQNDHMLDTSATPAGWSLAAWSGCVEARLNGHDTTDAAPTGPARFRPYFWPSTFRQVGTVAGGRCTAGKAYPQDASGNRFCHGDNDWGTGTNQPTQTDLDRNAHYMTMRNAGMTHAQSVGPNLLCAQTPIQPLTASRTAVNDSLAAITAPVRSGGTTTSVGLQGAWYTLSPNWQGFWQNPNTTIRDTPSLPLPYNTPNMRKVVVMLTDGDNNWQGPYGASCGSSSGSVCASATGTELMYNAYGRVAQYNARFPAARIDPVTQGNADTRLDQRFSAVCEAMKASPHNITVYVIGFEVSSAHRARLQSCASSPQHYFETPNAALLQATFRQIANQLTSVRLVN